MPILPVSSRANINELVGTLTLNDIHRSYGIKPSDHARTDGPVRERCRSLGETRPIRNAMVDSGDYLRMRILITGGGEVATHIAKRLSP